MAIEVGEFVRKKKDANQSGIVKDGKKIQAGVQMIPVQFGDGRLSWVPESTLELVATPIEDMATRFANGSFIDPAWLRRTLTRTRVTGHLGDVVYSMEATNTDFYAHQFKPVLKLLGSPTDSILIADEVGLGKTIEAGLIWTELRARLDSNRLLVICPKTLQDKWRQELDNRFGVEANIVNAKELLRLLEDHRGSQRGFAAIASMQGLRPPRGWNSDDEDGAPISGDVRRKLARLLDEAANDDPMIDLTIVDEAHHMRNPSTLLYQFGELINGVSSHRVFLSATPIHLRNRDLHSLLRLIDQDTFEFETTLEELILANEPIVAARDLLMQTNSSKKDVLALIGDARKLPLLSKNKSLELLCRDISQNSLDRVNRSQFATRLENANLMTNYMTRTRRRDVEDLKVVREPIAPSLEMHEDERAFYDAVTNEVTRYALDGSINARFLLSSPQRLLTSCPAAASSYWEKFGSYEINDVEETDNDLLTNDSNERPLLHKLSLLARRLGYSKRLAEVDTKYKLLKSQLTRLWQSEPEAKILIFSSFKPTLHYLKGRLNKDAVNCELLHGSVKGPREDILKRFKEDPQKRVLLSSEVGSEGVDLQFCWIVINYDLPWNPMKVEQRIGRVDRLGQQKEKVVILNLVYEHTIDATIYHRLFERLELIKRALGEFESVLGEPIREMTQSLLDPTLTLEQKKQVIDQTAQALENKKLNEEKLEMEAGALIQHGDYVLQQIYESRDLNRWVSGSDILIYVKDRLALSFHGCTIEGAPPGSETFQITLSDEARREFDLFLSRRRLRGSTRLLFGNKDHVYKFTSSVAKRRENRIEFISQFHPLVRFCVELDTLDKETKNAEPVATSINQGFAPDECENGVHVVAIRNWQATPVDGSANSAARIAYVGAELKGSMLISSTASEGLIGAVARNGKLLPNFAADNRLDEAANLLRGKILPELDRQYEEFVQQTQASMDDRANVRENALVRHRDTKSIEFRERSLKLKQSAEAALLSGNTRRHQQLMALAKASETKRTKLVEKTERRLNQIDSQRTFVPEWEDLSFVLVEVK
jgi:SNF2 family DNA or RNA helicase